MADWFADDSFWTEIFPFEFPETALAAGEAQVENAIRLAGVDSGAALDLGCGPGRHAVALAKRGFRVTAVDLSAFHLTKAQERAAAAEVAIELVRDGRIRTFEFTLRMYSGHELKQLRRAAGFATVRLHGDLDGRPYGQDVNRLVAVATK